MWNIVTLGIFTTDLAVALCVSSPDEQKTVFWTREYQDERDVSTIEGKVGDWIREYQPTWVVTNDDSDKSPIKPIIVRLLERRSVLRDEYDLDLMLSKIPNANQICVKLGVDILERNAFILAMIKHHELMIMKKSYVPYEEWLRQKKEKREQVSDPSKELVEAINKLTESVDQARNSLLAFMEIVLSRDMGSQSAIHEDEIEDEEPVDDIDVYPDGECPACGSISISAMGDHRRCRDCDRQWIVPS